MSIFSKIFTKKQPLPLEGLTDWHCHILPGVDDGVQEMSDSLAILSDYEEVGIRKVWLTPHIMEDVPNTPERLRARFEELKAAYNGPVELHLAAENMIDSLFSSRLEARNLLPIGQSQNMLLVETSYFNSPIGFDAAIGKVKSTGYYPLLAHPERYNYIGHMKEYDRIKAMDVRFQLNLLSLTGHYGPMVQEKAEKLLEKGMYDAVGSDLHRHEHLDILRNAQLSTKVLDRLNNVLQRLV